jgi:hypothetical protein
VDRRDSAPDRLEQRLRVLVAHRRQAERKGAPERRGGEEVSDLLDVGVAAQLATLDGFPQEPDERLVAEGG